MTVIDKDTITIDLTDKRAGQFVGKGYRVLDIGDRLQPGDERVQFSDVSRRGDTMHIHDSLWHALSIEEKGRKLSQDDVWSRVYRRKLIDDTVAKAEPPLCRILMGRSCMLANNCDGCIYDDADWPMMQITNIKDIEVIDVSKYRAFTVVEMGSAEHEDLLNDTLSYLRRAAVFYVPIYLHTNGISPFVTRRDLEEWDDIIDGLGIHVTSQLQLKLMSRYEEFDALKTVRLYTYTGAMYRAVNACNHGELQLRQVSADMVHPAEVFAFV